MKFAVIGEGVIDRFVSADGYQDVVGGSGLNTAIAAKLAGLDTHWISLEANDDVGRDVSDYASGHGVLALNRPRLNHPTPLVEIQLNPDGSPQYVFKIQNAVDWQWTEEHLEILKEYDVFHLTSLSAVLPPGTEAIFKFLQAKPSGLITTFDPNARPSALGQDLAGFARDRIESMVQLVDIVKVSEEDLAWIAPNDGSQTASRWSLSGPQFVIVTRGPEGLSLYVEGKEYARIPGISVDVIDTVGAGDTIMAWTLRSIENAQGIPTAEQLASDLQLAVKAAAITCSRQGCKPPTYLEVLER